MGFNLVDKYDEDSTEKDTYNLSQFHTHIIDYVLDKQRKDSSCEKYFWCAVLFGQLMIGLMLLDVLMRLAEIESGGNPNATSLLGAKYGRGLYKISEIALADYLQYHHHENIQPDDLYDVNTNKKIAVWLLEKRIPQLLTHYGLPVTDEAILHVYNFGIGSYRKWERNYNYVRKYYTEVNNG